MTVTSRGNALALFSLTTAVFGAGCGQVRSESQSDDGPGTVVPPPTLVENQPGAEPLEGASVAAGDPAAEWSPTLEVPPGNGGRGNLGDWNLQETTDGTGVNPQEATILALQAEAMHWYRRAAATFDSTVRALKMHQEVAQRFVSGQDEEYPHDAQHPDQWDERTRAQAEEQRQQLSAGMLHLRKLATDFNQRVADDTESLFTDVPKPEFLDVLEECDCSAALQQLALQPLPALAHFEKYLTVFDFRHIVHGEHGVPGGASFPDLSPAPSTREWFRVQLESYNDKIVELLDRMDALQTFMAGDDPDFPDAAQLETDWSRLTRAQAGFLRRAVVESRMDLRDIAAEYNSVVAEQTEIQGERFLQGVPLPLRLPGAEQRFDDDPHHINIPIPVWVPESVAPFVPENETDSQQATT